MNLSFLFFSLLISVVLSYVFLPRLLSSLGELVGYNLRRSSQIRRELLLARVQAEQRSYSCTSTIGPSVTEDDDWEEIEGYAAGTAANGAKASEDWKGIVGFFHPFW
jgi:alpha-1,2-mannosyltransferase